MKKTYKIISYTSIILFGLLLISSKFLDYNEYNNTDLRNLLVVIYLFTSLKYYKIVSTEKDEIISSLNKELGKK